MNKIHLASQKKLRFVAHLPKKKLKSVNYYRSTEPFVMKNR